MHGDSLEGVAFAQYVYNGFTIRRKVFMLREREKNVY